LPQRRTKFKKKSLTLVQLAEFRRLRGQRKVLEKPQDGGKKRGGVAELVGLNGTGPPKMLTPNHGVSREEKHQPLFVMASKNEGYPKSL